MQQIKDKLLIIVLILMLGLSIFTDWYGPISLSLFLVLIFFMLDKLGSGIVLREIVALHTCFICILMPLLGYAAFTKNNPLAKLWGKYMPIPEEVYCSFALPAVIAFILALFLPSKKPEAVDYGPSLEEKLARSKKFLAKNPYTGLYILSIGTVTFWMVNYVPQSLQFVFQLFFFGAFSGFLYIYYAKDFRFRKLILVFFAIFIMMGALNSGMFTVVAYMGLTIFSFFFLGRKVAFWKKVLALFVGIFILIMIQTVKPTYRKMTWGGKYEGNNLTLFTNLLYDKFFNLDWKSTDAFFPIYYRTNQGFNIALVMRRFPDKKPYDGGTNIALAAASALVPRFLWPDKPQAGGQFNMEYYVGIYIQGWSTNVGPLGEAYGSFGPLGGAIFMFFMGLLIRGVYFHVFSLARKTPLLILWIPVMFYQTTYSAETDTLQIFNSLLKASFFVFLLYKFLPHWFGKQKKGT